LNKYLLIILAVFALTSCLDLSPALFNPTATDSYVLDKNDSEIDSLPELFQVIPGEVTEIQVTSSLDGDQETIYGAYLGDINTIDQDSVILYCHGNAGNIDLYFSRVKMLYNANRKSGFGVLIYDYRGFGKSTGTTTVESLNADTKAVIEWLAEQGVNEERFFVYGFSLGSIPAVHSCHTNLGLNPKKLMLEAPIGSIDAMAQDGSGLSISGSYLADAEVDNIEDIKLVKQDLYWLHGIDDDFLAAKTHGEPIFVNHDSNYKIPVLVEGGNHGDTPFVQGIENYIETIENFLNQE